MLGNKTNSSIKKLKNGILYKGDMVKEKREGKGHQEWPDGRTYDGDFSDDLLNGFGVYKVFLFSLVSK